METHENSFESVIFPVAVRIAARTIGQNLVAVKPMPYPYGYETAQEKYDKLIKARRTKLKKILGKSF